MFDINKFYDECSGFTSVKSNEVYDYIRSFKKVIIWGASFLGKAVCKKLLNDHIKPDLFWDVRYKEIGTVNGIPVEEPFSRNYNRETTLVIFCIGYHAIMPTLLLKLKTNSYCNVLRGDYLYSGLICQCNEKTELCAETCWSSQECRPLLCDKLLNIIKYQSANRITKPGKRIDFAFNTIIINTKCNLSCKYCLQYINSYPPERRTNVPFDQIARDIDIYFDAIDSVGTVTVMGGEPFLHPDLGRIVNKLSTKKNIALISVATNGLVLLKENQLAGFGDSRISVNISNYDDIATERQLEIRQKNIELMQKSNIPYTLGLPLPTWSVPPVMGKERFETDEELIVKKKNCKMPPRDFQLKSGKLHVCDKALAMHNMGLESFEADYIDLTKEWNIAELREAIRDLINKDFYQSCAYCRKEGGGGVNSGEQGCREIFRD